MLERELALRHITRIGLPEDGVTVTRDNLSAFEGRPDVLTDCLVGRVLANLGLHLAEPDKDLLVCETMKRASKAVQGGSKGEVGIRESGADELASVGGDVATFVVSMDREVETHELDEVRLVGIAEEVG